MKMTLQHFHITSCHQENDGIPSHYNVSTITPCKSLVLPLETFKDMDSLSVESNSRLPQNTCSSQCFDKAQMSFVLAAGKCCSSRLENGQYSEVGDDGRKHKHNAAARENTNESLVNGKETMEGGKSKVCNRGHWRPAEDSKLKELVAFHGPQNWNLIAEKLQGRSGKSCRLRWFNQLDPKINRTAFNEEEEERLMAAHRVYGNKWALIARFFPGRTDNAVKNHWHVVMARKYREQSCIYRRRKRTQASQRRAKSVSDSMRRNTAMNTEANSNIICSSIIIKPSCLPFSPLIGGSNSSCQMTAGLLFSRSNNFLFVHHGSLAEETPGFFSGFSDSMASAATQTTVSEPSSSLSVAENTEANPFEIAAPPPFIDFLGVGAT